MATQEGKKNYIDRPAGIDDDNFILNCTDLAKETLREYGAKSGNIKEISVPYDEIKEGVTIKAYDTIQEREDSSNNKSREEK